MQQRKRYGNRQGRRVKSKNQSRLTARIRDLHDATRELVQLGFYLILSGLSLGMVLVGASRIRFWLG